MENNNYGFGKFTKELFQNQVDNNVVNDISMYPYPNYNDVLKEEIDLHKMDENNPHKVTTNQIKAVSFDIDQSSIFDSTEKALARRNIGMDRVVNTSDTDEIIKDSDLKLTSGGAYNLKQSVIDEFKVSRKVESELENRIIILENKINKLLEKIGELENKLS